MLHLLVAAALAASAVGLLGMLGTYGVGSSVSLASNLEPAPAPGTPSVPAPATRPAESELGAWIAAGVPTMQALGFHTDLDDALAHAREKMSPVLHFVAAPDAADSLDLLMAHLDANDRARAVVSRCVLARGLVQGLVRSPSIAVHSTEVVTTSDGVLRPAADGAYTFEVAATATSTAFTVACRKPTGRIVQGLDGRPIVRHRIVDFFAGVPDLDRMGVRVYSLLHGQPPLDEALTRLHQGRLDRAGLAELLGDDLYGLISSEERLLAAGRLLEAPPETPAEWLRAFGVVLGSDEREPAARLAALRQTVGADHTLPRMLLEAEGARRLDGDLARAGEWLARAQLAAPSDPAIARRRAEVALAGCEAARDPAARATWSATLGTALHELLARDPDSPVTSQLVQRAGAIGIAADPPPESAPRSSKSP